MSRDLGQVPGNGCVCAGEKIRGPQMMQNSWAVHGWVGERNQGTGECWVICWKLRFSAGGAEIEVCWKLWESGMLDVHRRNAWVGWVGGVHGLSLGYSFRSRSAVQGAGPQGTRCAECKTHIHTHTQNTKSESQQIS